MRYFQNQRLLLAVAALLNTLCSEAGEIASQQAPAVKTKAAVTKPASMLNEVAVTATRSEADVKDIPANITTLDRRLPLDEADLFRDEPDVVVARDLRRFGSTRVNIRGLEDVCVVQMVDGVRLPDFYNGGGPTNFTMSGPQLIMPDFIKRMEILRGSASSLYGTAENSHRTTIGEANRSTRPKQIDLSGYRLDLSRYGSGRLAAAL